MVKGKLGALVLGIFVFLILMNAVHAAGSKLLFSDVDVKVGSKTSKNLDDGDTINDEAEPGDTVEFRIEVRNNFTDAEDLDIENIVVEVTIEGIDDGDDFDDESSDFDLRADSDKRVTIEFQVPIEVEEDTFDVTIHAEGEDQNGTDHDADMKLRLEVNKESHLLTITRLSLSPAEISCNRKNVQVSTTVINTGNEDQEDVSIQVLNSDLGVDLQEIVDELTAEPNEDESKFSGTFNFNVNDDADAGSYPILLRALYNDGREKSEETATLTVNDCSTAKPVQTNDEEPEVTDEEGVEVITGNAPSTSGQPSPDTVVTQESFLSSDAFVVGVIIAEIVVVIVGLVLVISLFRKKG